MNTEKNIQQTNLNRYFSKETTYILKGIMIVFMFIHHIFTFPEWYNEGISYPELTWFAVHLNKPFRICVPVFAFLTGYLYSFSSKDFKYSIKKITDIFITYWTIYIPYLVIALLLGNIELDLKGILLEVFALERPIMVFCWYVYFYFVVMLLLPLIERVAKQNIIKLVVVGIIIPYMICKIFTAKVDNTILRDVFSNTGSYFPIVMIGLLFSKYSLFGNCCDRMMKNNIHSRHLKIMLWIVLAIFMFWGQNYKDGLIIENMQYLSKVLSIVMKMLMRYLSIPIFVYVMINLIDTFSVPILSRLIAIIGKNSLLMWFIHCIFFSVCDKFFQPILYFPHNPILVLIWGLLLCCIIAVVVDIPLKKILSKKNG